MLSSFQHLKTYICFQKYQSVFVEEQLNIRTATECEQNLMIAAIKIPN